jgi:hypothetical protein
MSLRSRLDRALGLGPSDEPRAVAVAARRTVTLRPVASTPGARVRVARDGWSPDTSNVLLMCQRRGIPVELVDGPSGFWLDGAPVSAEELAKRLR